jgi:hypothetical protein
MGDMADMYIDNGICQLAAHKNGECEEYCPYCLEEDENG